PPQPADAETAPVPEQQFQPAAADDGDGSGCPWCGTPVDVADGDEGLVAFCPECGQCMRAPRPWSPSAPAGGVRRLPRPEGKARRKLPGWYGVILGGMLAAVWVIPGISVYLGLAAVILGAALFLEGAGRLRAAAHKRQPRRPAQTDELPQELPPRVYELGGLSAVYRTTNSWA